MINCKRYFILALLVNFIFFFNRSPLLAQVSTVIFVFDAHTGIPIENVNVTNIKTGALHITDIRGSCRVKLLDTNSFLVSHVSYKDTTIVASFADSHIYVSLYPQELDAIEIYAGEPFNKKAAQGVNHVLIPFLKAVPSFLGEADIIKGLTFLPGVSGGNEGYSHLLIRGGNQDQNLILFDGASMFNINHFGGYISMFQPELIGGLDFYNNYWPSKFGGRLSAVLDIKTKEGNYKEHHQSFQFGVMGPKISATGPLYKEKWSYNIGMRRTIIDLVTAARASKIRKGDRTGDIGNLITQDLTMRLDGQLSENQHISFTALLAGDKYSFLENNAKYNQFAEDNYNIRNSLLALNYSLNIGLSTALHAHASTSKYKHFYKDYSRNSDQQNNGIVSTRLVENYRLSGNDVNSIKFSVQGKTQLNNSLTINYGLEHERFDFGIYLNRKEVVDGSITNIYSNTLNQNAVVNTALSTDISYRLSNRFRLNTGVRLSLYAVDSIGTFIPEPKVLFTYKVNERSTLNTAFTIQRQNLILLGFTDGLGRFREFYVSNNRYSPAAISKQWSMGYFHNSTAIVNNISFEIFFKDQSNMVKYVPSVDFDKDVLNYDQFLHRNGKMRTYGVEVLLQKTSGKLFGSLSYTFANSKSRFSALNQGQWFNADFDSRHSANFLVMYSFGKGYKLSGNWIYKTGRPFTLPTSRAESDDWRIGFNIMNDVNNVRLPAFHRLDINIERKWKTKKGNSNWFTVGVYNVYNRVNPFFAQPTDIPNKLEVRGLFPILPFFTFGFEL